MALTANPQSALPHDRAWGEVIVPTLRKRLEDESHVLAKRMSAASMGSSDDHLPRSLDSFHTQSNIILVSSSPSSSAIRDKQHSSPIPLKPSAIPRPSLQYSRAETPSGSQSQSAAATPGSFSSGQPANPSPPQGTTPGAGPAASASAFSTRSSRSGSFKRSRTVSQPFPFDIPSATASPPLPPPPLPHQHSYHHNVYYHQPQSSASFGRSDSPMTPQSSIKGTRIPVSRARASSTSSNQFSFNAAASTSGSTGVPGTSSSKLSNGGFTSPGDSDLWPVSESYHNQVTGSIASKSTMTMKTPRSGMSELVNEQAPFNPNSASSRNGLYGLASSGGALSDVGEYPEATVVDGYSSVSATRPNRFSSDSDERPFEHWYRGDVSRNGGVGELRVARKQEMLDIANYGHTLRQASGRFGTGNAGVVEQHAGYVGGYAGHGGYSPSARSRSNSRGEVGLGIYGAGVGRPRSGSMGANDDFGPYGRGRRGGRESFYMDDDEYVGRDGDMVLDERPLTDLDTDEESAAATGRGEDDGDFDDEYDYGDDGGGGLGVGMLDGDYYEGSPSPPLVHSYSHSRNPSQSAHGHGRDTPSSSAHGPATATTANSTPIPTPTTTNSTFKTRIPTPTSRPQPSTGRSSSSETSRSINQTNGTPTTGNTSIPPRTPTPSSSLKPKTPPSPGNRPRKATNASIGSNSAAAGGKRAKSPAAGSTKTTASSIGPGTPQSRSPGANGTPNRTRSPGGVSAKSPNGKKSGPPVKKVVVKKKEEEVRRSSAQYPGIGGEDGDMANAIPSWTEPVGKNGNWDDVVLPVVARKKGLDGYEQADGNPRPKPTSTEPAYEPAPGTFGFDNTKRRPPRTNLNPEDISMDEFGIRKPSFGSSSSPDQGEEEQDNELYPPDAYVSQKTPSPHPSASQQLQPEPSPILEPPSPLRSGNGRADSPAPFSHYANAVANGEKGAGYGNGMGVGQVVDGGSGRRQELEMQVDEKDGGAGCCKCVVM